MISPTLYKELNRKSMPERYKVLDRDGKEVSVFIPMKTMSSVCAFEARVHKNFYDNTYPPYKVVDTKTNEIVRVIEEN